MTDEQAALCVQAYWRRYLSVIYFQESRGAAITMQARAATSNPTLRAHPPLSQTSREHTTIRAHTATTAHADAGGVSRDEAT